nr:flavin-containing monooxygenase fmo gs-ox1 [Quercus suber]
MSATPDPIISRHVAVIGAGASGLVTARELRREGHTVVVFERGDQVGGAWVYTPKADSDPELTRTTVHSSLYHSLRTNLPRESMGFMDYPFLAKDDPDRDPRRYPGHREVMMYLQDFTREFGIGAYTAVVNLDFLVWKSKEKALLTFLSSILTPSILALTVWCSSALEVWKVLENRFSSISRSHVMNLNELLHITLKGLPKEYNAFRSAIRTRSTHVSFNDLSTMLNAKEESLNDGSEIKDTIFAMAATTTPKPNNHGD